MAVFFFVSVTLLVLLPSLGYVLVDILHLDHAELDVFMAKLQVRLATSVQDLPDYFL